MVFVAVFEDGEEVAGYVRKSRLCDSEMTIACGWTNAFSVAHVFVLVFAITRVRVRVVRRCDRISGCSVTITTSESCAIVVMRESTSIGLSLIHI